MRPGVGVGARPGRPAQRPSAADLLNGPLLPAPRELSTEVLDAATSALRNPLSPARATLLDALFDAPTSELVDVAYDQNERGAFSVAALRDSRAREAARRRVVDQLEKAGAAPLDAPLLRPKPPPRDDVVDGDEVVLVDARGTSVLLPRESTTSFARRVARSALSRRKARASFGTCKRYACAKVFAPSAARPRHKQRQEIAYDCVSRAAPEAVVCGEALALCVDACRAASGDADLAVEVRASHANLAPALAGLRQTAPPKIRDALDAQGGILRGGAVQALERLRSLLRRPVSDVAKRFEGSRRDAAGAVRDLFDAVTCAALAGIEDARRRAAARRGRGCTTNQSRVVVAAVLGPARGAHAPPLVDPRRERRRRRAKGGAPVLAGRGLDDYYCGRGLGRGGALRGRLL